MIGAAVVRSCHKQACREQAQRDGRAVVEAAVSFSDVCGGEDNRTAVVAMVEAMRRTGRAKLLVVGGALNSVRELRELCAKRCEVRFLTLEDAPRRRTSDEQVRWADVVVIWASTPIPHKMTQAIRGHHVITCTRRGVAALAQTVAAHLAA